MTFLGYTKWAHELWVLQTYRHTDRATTWGPIRPKNSKLWRSVLIYIIMKTEESILITRFNNGELNNDDSTITNNSNLTWILWFDIKAIRSAELCWTTCICYSSWRPTAGGQWAIFTDPVCHLIKWMNRGKKRKTLNKCVTLTLQLSVAELINEVVSIS